MVFGNIDVKNKTPIFPLQTTREPLPFPKLRIKRKVETIEDFTIDDLEVEGYKSHGKLEMKMAV